MYIEAVPNRNSPPAILLRESYRGEDGKVKKRTVANLSSLKPEVIEGLRVLLKGGHASDKPPDEQFKVERTLPHGHVAAALGLFGKLGMFPLLERKRSGERSLAAALIVSRLLDPGSKLALSRQLSRETATNTLGEELGLEEKVGEKDLYRAMAWLLERQDKIERRLAEKHLNDSDPVLYDLSSTYYEGSTCVLAQRGYSRDGKKGTRQINFGLLCSSEGCPVAVEVFPGNTGDPATVQAQVDKLRERFGMERILLVGDRGMLTGARIEALKECEGISWISALQNAGVRRLARSGAVQMELFDKRDLVEIRCEEDFPGERLVVCLNPALREERARKRAELLEATERKLRDISDACARTRNPYRGKGRIARRVEREAGKYKMLKHFKLSFSETGLDFERDESSIAEESALDGLYVVRAKDEGTGHMDEAQLVRTYKSLSGVESAFRSIKTETLHVRPVFHRQEDMVRAHIFVCMLAYHLQWHLTRALAPVLFEDEVPGGAPRSSPVAKARRSEAAEAKAADKQTTDGLCVHGFKMLLDELATLCRVTVRPDIKNADAFFKLAEPTRIQEKVFDLLGFKPPIAPCSQ
ncbi:MAG: IS1634 family transposase [Verrucomicrobia bacterium]|jgi:transposase|nr:IS1634 family transposase [Verrucomicrobiota bacterium]